MTVNETTNHAIVPTIYTQEPGKYYAWRHPDGWNVIFLIDRHNFRNVDGGKVHKSRQNAYAKAKRMNDALKRILEKHGMAEAEYNFGYIANVGYGYGANDLGGYEDGLFLTLRQGEMPPFQTTFFTSLDKLEQYVRQELPQPLNWHKVEPEEN